MTNKLTLVLAESDKIPALDEAINTLCTYCYYELDERLWYLHFDNKLYMDMFIERMENIQSDLYWIQQCYGL